MNPLIKDLAKEKILFVGLGIDNYALLAYLRQQSSDLNITVFEGRSAKDLGNRYTKLKKYKNIVWHFGEAKPKHLDNYSLIFKSPGAFFSPAQRRNLLKHKITITSALQLFLDLSPSRNLIGVTGTKGKGTTSSLVYSILKVAGKRAWLGGNIGVALFDILPKVKKSDWIVLELSSFQLEDMKPDLKVAVFTNFSPEHLSAADPANPNHHLSLNAYWQAKLQLARFQKNGLIIANRNLKTRLSKAKLASRIIYTTISVLASSLPGQHNKENIALAETTTRAVGISTRAIARAVAAFKGLPYRLEKIIVKGGIAYYNDSFSTTPSSTITALKAFKQPIILIAGGADKGSDFNRLAKEIEQRTKTVILFKGTALRKIKAALAKVGYDKKLLIEASDMNKAITLARRATKPGDIILMSPACASFGIFKNYKDRGEQFNREVKK